MLRYGDIAVLTDQDEIAWASLFDELRKLPRS